MTSHTEDDLETTDDTEEMLAADNPSAAYETVPGTERLPAATVDDKQTDGIEPQQDTKATERFRKDDEIRVVALGQVKA